MRGCLALAVLLAAAPVAAQDAQPWIDYNIGTGQAAVLDHINRENAKRLHREKGLPPPDFDAARRRLRQQEARRTSAPAPSSSLAEKCAWIRARLDRLTPSQLAGYRRACP
jgi:hypothetical protein